MPELIHVLVIYQQISLCDLSYCGIFGSDELTGLASNLSSIYGYITNSNHTFLIQNSYRVHVRLFATALIYCPQLFVTKIVSFTSIHGAYIFNTSPGLTHISTITYLHGTQYNLTFQYQNVRTAYLEMMFITYLSLIILQPPMVLPITSLFSY